MGNRPSRAQVIEIKRVEIVRKPQQPNADPNRSQPTSKKLEDDSGKRRGQTDKDAKKPPERDKTGLDDKARQKKQEEDRKRKQDEDHKRKQDEDQKRKQDEDQKRKRRHKTRSPDDQKIGPEFSKEPELKAETFNSAIDIATDTTDAPKKENIIKKIIRLSQITQMSPKDFIAMFILWSLRFFIPWVFTWWEFNKHILSDPAHLGELANWLFTQEIIAFVVCCIICVLLSVFADVFNLKYYVYLALIALYILCPVTGICAINILWARGYARQIYHKYSPTIYVLMEWAKAIPFMAYPLEFSCFFTQVDDMSREAHYNYAAIFIFLDSLNRLICFFVIPGQCPTLQWTLASVWIAIGIVIHTLFLLSSFFARFVKPPNKVLNRSPFVLKVVRLINKILTKIKMTACLISEEPQGVKLDNFNKKATPFLKKMKLILFGLMLIPIIYSSFVIAIMHRLELDEDWDKHEFHNATSMFLFGKVIGVIIIAVLLFFLRRNKKIKILNRFSFTRPDVLVLGLPHVLIILALVIITGRFGSLLSLKEGDVMVGPVPDDGRSVIEFYNADFRNRTVCVFSEKFRPVKVGPRKRETRKPPDPGVTKYEISVTIAPRTTPPVVTYEILDFKKDSLITYVITLNSSEATANDLEALYNKFELMRVSGTESVKPKKEPQLIIINTFLMNTSSYMVSVNQFQANFSKKVEIPPREQALVMDLVHGRVDIRYENEGKNNSQAPTPPIIDYINAENYTVWTIVLGLATARNASNETEPYNVIMTKHKIMQVAGEEGNPLPDKRQLQQDKAIMMGTCLGGIAESGIQVGFIYLFWLDTPIGELRATTLACFLIALAIPQEFPRLKLVDISTGVAAFLLILQIIFTVCHFIGAIFLYDQAFNFRKRDD